ncbi:YuiA family protein [Brevibacillus sp. GCM10020057]
MRKKQEQCPYCNGQGYFQLILGGTENCPNCEGAGTHHQEKPANAGNQ